MRPAGKCSGSRSARGWPGCGVTRTSAAGRTVVTWRRGRWWTTPARRGGGGRRQRGAAVVGSRDEAGQAEWAAETGPATAESRGPTVVPGRVAWRASAAWVPQPGSGATTPSEGDDGRRGTPSAMCAGDTPAPSVAGAWPGGQDPTHTPLSGDSTRRTVDECRDQSQRVGTTQGNAQGSLILPCNICATNAVVEERDTTNPGRVEKYRLGRGARTCAR